MSDLFTHSNESVAHHVVTGLTKISLALKSHAWQEGEGRGLTPTQAQILTLLRLRSTGGVRLTELANALAVSLATTSEAVDALVRKDFVQKARHLEDKRVLALTLTEAGSREADHVAGWPDFLLKAVDALSPDEQTAFLTGLIKMIRTLQVQGQIPVSQMCVTCRFFQPNVYADPERPHHCAFVNAPFGDRQLRLSCSDHETAPTEEAQQVWLRFVAPRSRQVISLQPLPSENSALKISKEDSQ